MAIVSQLVIPQRTYSPFEGMSEAQRLVTAVPRGIIRFFSDEALEAKPVNDDMQLQFTCALPGGFAYVMSALNFTIQVSTADEWEGVCRGMIFNGIPGGTPNNQQVSIFTFADLVSSPGTREKILDFSRGSVREWYPQPLVRTEGGTGHSFILEASNGNNNVQAAGTMFFNASFYQYELNQAVRFPLNFPIPVGIR